MQRWCWTVLFLATVIVPARGHFIYIVPSADGKTALVVFSDELGPDEAVPITKITQTRLYLQGKDGSASALEMTQKGNAYVVSLPAGATHTIGGTCLYGVLDKGAEPYLLNYYPRAVLGRGDMSAVWNKLPLQIVLNGDKGTVLFKGRPVAGAEVTYQSPGENKRVKIPTGEDGTFNFPIPKGNGLVAFLARHIEAKAGTYEGKEFKESRHYATLVVSAATLNGQGASAEAAPEK
jgi:hypothetical protein